MRKKTKLVILGASLLSNIGVLGTAVYKQTTTERSPLTLAIFFSAGMTFIRTALETVKVIGEREQIATLESISIDGDSPRAAIISSEPKKTSFVQMEIMRQEQRSNELPNHGL